MTRFWDGRTDGRTDGRSDCTPRPAFALGDAGKNMIYIYHDQIIQQEAYGPHRSPEAHF